MCFWIFAAMTKFIESVQSLGQSVSCGGVPVSACTSKPDLRRSKPAFLYNATASVAGQTGLQAGRRVGGRLLLLVLCPVIPSPDPPGLSSHPTR